MKTNLPWFEGGKFPVMLAPMAGVTDEIFRGICKELGADIMVSEFVSAEGILQKDDRTRKYVEFDESQRPVGVQLFGADGEKMGEAACRILEWKHPDFIDINFGCPVNKVVAKNGGSSLLKDPLLVQKIVRSVVQKVKNFSPETPVTAKMRIGWDQQNINAKEICQIFCDEGIEMITIHGRTRSQGYGGLANWEIIDECARSFPLPIVGNGDIRQASDVLQKREKTAVSGVMIGRAAMENPWIFAQAKALLSGKQINEVSWNMKKALMLRQAILTVNSGRYGNELQSMKAMRSRLMAYCKGFSGAKELRQQMCRVGSILQLEENLNSISILE